MASGPTHYARAERLLELAEDVSMRSPEGEQARQALAGMALAHATLALAAATARPAVKLGNIALADEWKDVTI